MNTLTEAKVPFKNNLPTPNAQIASLEQYGVVSAELPNVRPIDESIVIAIIDECEGNIARMILEAILKLTGGTFPAEYQLSFNVNVTANDKGVKRFTTFDRHIVDGVQTLEVTLHVANTPRLSSGKVDEDAVRDDLAIEVAGVYVAEARGMGESFNKTRVKASVVNTPLRFVNRKIDSDGGTSGADNRPANFFDIDELSVAKLIDHIQRIAYIIDANVAEAKAAKDAKASKAKAAKAAKGILTFKTPKGLTFELKATKQLVAELKSLGIKTI